MIKKIIGTWKLISLEFHAGDGTITHPLGKDVSGLLMYDARGYMSTQATRSQRLTKETLKADPEELKAAFEGFMAYYGTWQVDEEKQVVTHSVKEGSPFQHFVNTTQTRLCEFKGKRLILKPYPELDAQFVVVWERVEPA